MSMTVSGVAPKFKWNPSFGCIASWSTEGAVSEENVHLVPFL